MVVSIGNGLHAYYREHNSHLAESVELGPFAVGTINCLIFVTLRNFREIVEGDNLGGLLEEPETLHRVPRQDEDIVEKRVGMKHLFYYKL